jgi:hypothetical protein
MSGFDTAVERASRESPTQSVLAKSGDERTNSPCSFSSSYFAVSARDSEIYANVSVSEPAR